MKPAVAIKILSPKEKLAFKKDLLIKLIAIPILATGIVNLTHIITNVRYDVLHLIINYSYFMALAWSIWQGNVQLFLFVKKQLHFPLKTYYKSILVLYGFIIAYTALIATGGILLWLMFSHEDGAAYKNVFNAVIAIVVSAVFITNLYE